MERFRINDLSEWHYVDTDEIIQFNAQKQRVVKFALNVSAPVQVWAGHDDDLADAKLVAACSGLFAVEFSISKPVFVKVVSEQSADFDVPVSIYLNADAKSQSLIAEQKEVFTQIEPRKRRNTEFDRMWMLTQLNEQRREQEVQAAIAALQDQIQASAAPVDDQNDIVEGGQDDASESSDSAADTSQDEQSEES
ncbi:hypothetical protein [Epibacterium ulvae]|uniref:hypothetical protein n=1 Tax=Epibacterium ulvae TaxID=1156985 RepID=UPI000C2231DE|nr:hypothetical protein [Epibacterium ulvae]